MPLNVAQLQIGVTADVSQAQAAIQGLNTNLVAMGQQALSSAAGLGQAIQQATVPLAIMPAQLASINTNMQSLWPAATAGAEQFGAAMQGVNASVAGMGSVGSIGASALGNLNMAMVASGQSLGPLNSGLMLLSSGLRQMPSEAGAATTALYGIAAAATAVGVAAVAMAAPLHQATAGLASAMQNNGDAIGEWGRELDQAAGHAQNLGISTANMEKGLTVLVRGLGDTNLALSELNDAESLAAARHQSVEAGAQTIIRAYEGYGRSLKELGINMTFVKNTQQALDAANRTLADSQQHLADVTARYNEALERNNAVHQEAALARDRVAQATQRLGDAEANLAYTEAKLNAESQVPRLSEEARATDALAEAEENLAYVQSVLAAQAEIPITNHAAEALRSLQDAEISLSSANARLADSTNITQVEMDQASQAADRVAEAQQRMAEATGGSILGAQIALRNAISQQREELDKLHAKLAGNTSQEVSAKNEVARATLALAAAQQKYIDAQKQDKGEADLKAIENAHRLEVAEDAVNKARAAVPFAIQKDYADAQLKSIENANTLRTASNQVRDAQQALSQAYRDNQAEALKLHIADLAVADAKRALNDATRKEQEAQAKVVEATARHNQELQQQQKVLAAIHDKIKGFAESQAQGWVGSVNRIKAAITNWLGHFGDASGKFLVFALPVMLMLKGLGGALFGGSAAAGGAEAAGGLAAGAEGGGLIAGLGSLAAAAAPVLLVVAVVAAVAAAAYLAYTHFKAFHDAVDAVGRTIKSALIAVLHELNGPLKELSGLWKTITKDVSQLAHEVFKFFGDQVKSVTKFLHEHKAEIDSLKSTLSGLLNIFKNVAEFLGHVLKPAMQAVVTAFKIGWDIIWTVVRVAWALIKGVIKTTLDIIMGVIGVFLDILAGHWGKAWHELLGTVTKVFKDIWGTITSVLGEIAKGIGKLAGDIVHGFWQGLVDMFQLIFDLPGLVWKHIIKPILEFFGIASPSRKMHDIGGDIIKGLWNGIVDIFNTVVNLERLFYDKIIKPAFGLYENMLNAGKNLLIGLWNGIVGWAGEFVDKIKGFFGGIVDDIGSFLGIGSPSRITHQHGRWLMEGLADGIRDGMPHVLNQIDYSADTFRTALLHMGLGGSGSVGFGGIKLGASGPGTVGAGGSPVIINNFNKELLRVDGNLIHERDLPQYLKKVVVPAARREGGNFWGGWG